MPSVNPPLTLFPYDFSSPEGKKALIDVLDQLWTRTGGSTDLIEDLGVSQTTEDGGNRTYRRYEDDIHEIYGQLTEIKRQNRHLEQMVFELSEIIGQLHRQNRRLEQELNEIIQRVDNGIT